MAGKRVVWILGAVLATTSVANAAITDAAGAVVQISTPTSVLLGDLQSSTVIFSFNERENLALPFDLWVDASEAGRYRRETELTPATIPAGTLVNAHILHLDPIGSNVVELTGSLTFDQDILGLIVLDASLDASDGILGAPGTLYPTGAAGRGFEGPHDIFTIEPDLRTLTINNLRASTMIDQIRVITAAIPAPGVLALFGLAALTVVRPRRK
ncbi:MAG: hypothetical protein ACYS0G_11020 [Planctomycetota bacterium]|jgi:hypothetical protein